MLVLTQTEKQELKEESQQSGKSMSELIREDILFKKTYKPIVERVREILREING